MNIEVKQRKAAVRRTKPTTTHLPKEVKSFLLVYIVNLRKMFCYKYSWQE